MKKVDPNKIIIKEPIMIRDSNGTELIIVLLFLILIFSIVIGYSIQ